MFHPSKSGTQSKFINIHAQFLLIVTEAPRRSSQEGAEKMFCEEGRTARKGHGAQGFFVQSES
jgi:hypothetical protein